MDSISDAFVAKVSEDIISFRVSTSSLRFNFVEGAGNTSSQSFSVERLAGPGEFAWDISTNAPWLSLNYSTPDISPTIVEVTPDTSSLAPGVYAAEITVTATDPAGESKTAVVAVSLTVSAGSEPVLQVGPNFLSFAAVAGEANPIPASFVVQNIGNGQVNWTATKRCALAEFESCRGNGCRSIRHRDRNRGHQHPRSRRSRRTNHHCERQRTGQSPSRNRSY